MEASNGPDVFLERQRSIHELEELKDIAVAVDATYYLQSILNVKPNEPLLSALGGVTGIVSRIEADLDSWDENNTTPFFIFDGVPITGEDAVASQRAREANIKTDLAWELYFNGRANEAVAAFGENTSE
ncbi:hypothetical protein QBC35DRAFT_132971 [Podospora australis]|uniref:XPG N-terminal domain-containing protein n=1 Tax=Podospora australis TaxID=1536484 RepID=A0AAN7ALA6_9PEZI|nr:hypothetical protein QBC35DRAFT_132971 [Podospora australis]